MKDYELSMVDARAQVKEALEGMSCLIPFTLCSRFPKGSTEGNVVTWSEYSNVSTDIGVVDEVIYQIDLWATEGDSQFELAQSVNRAMVGIGFRRVFAGPIKHEDVGAGYLHRILRFGRKVDKRFMRLID